MEIHWRFHVCEFRRPQHPTPESNHLNVGKKTVAGHAHPRTPRKSRLNNALDDRREGEQMVPGIPTRYSVSRLPRQKVRRPIEKQLSINEATFYIRKLELVKSHVLNH
jgi:hypothetical protein